MAWPGMGAPRRDAHCPRHPRQACRARHRTDPAGVGADVGRRQSISGPSASRWTDKELIVHGYEGHSDAHWLDWLAVHPSAAARLGWTADPGELFAWYGPDGTWRARTLRRAHGQLSHQPPGTGACAEGWQVVVSDIGYAELLTVFPEMTRTLYLSRKLPPTVVNRGLQMNEQCRSWSTTGEASRVPGSLRPIMQFQPSQARRGQAGG